MMSKGTGTAGEHALTQANGLPGNLLRRCHQIGVAVFLDHCRPFDLTPLQYVALAALEEHGPVDQVTLGGLIALDRTTVAVVIRKLEERGLLQRRRSVEDRRSILVDITPAGQSLRAAAGQAVLAAQDDILKPLTAGERAELARLLTKLADGNNTRSRAPVRRRARPGAAAAAL
ncbi:MarR family winged helix-turn-helix transcriptional regulator [Azospirillum sp. ST 5-10]|uniref:MarR family winged helix-turn-helix transcriptional regulator n=1 Tax=unclassified Azospirillum TaxID=2630922 RepID=UPI003F49CFDF